MQKEPFAIHWTENSVDIGKLHFYFRNFVQSSCAIFTRNPSISGVIIIWHDSRELTERAFELSRRSFSLSDLAGSMLDIDHQR
jgi:hypothetical protein